MGRLGAFVGALLNPDDPLHGAASGALGAMVAETAAETLMKASAVSSYQEYMQACEREGVVPTVAGYEAAAEQPSFYHPDRQKFEDVGKMSKIIAATATMLANFDPDIAFRAADNAIENNFMLMVYNKEHEAHDLAFSEQWLAGEYAKEMIEQEKEAHRKANLKGMDLFVDAVKEATAECAVEVALNVIPVGKAIGGAVAGTMKGAKAC